MVRAARKQLREFEQRATVDPLQPDLFAQDFSVEAPEAEPHPLVEQLAAIDPDRLTPREALDLHLAQLPADLEIHWLVVPFLLHAHSTFEMLCRHALERGGGFRVGIGDNPSLFRDARNAELVEQVRPWIEASGRRVATTRDVRALRRSATS